MVQPGNNPIISRDVFPTSLLCGSCSIRKFAFYGMLDPAHIVEIQERRKTCRTVKAGEIIVRAGAAPSEGCTLLSGWAYRFVLLPDGRRQILHYYLPGSFIPIESFYVDRVYFPVQALTDIMLCVFDFEAIKIFMESHPQVRHRVEGLIAQRALAAEEQLVSIGRMAAQGRLARLIVDLYDRLLHRGMVDGNTFQWPLRQKHIADTLGLTSVHVSRILQTLRHENLAVVHGRTVTILDESRLRAQAYR